MQVFQNKNPLRRQDGESEPVETNPVDPKSKNVKPWSVGRFFRGLLLLAAILLLFGGVIYHYSIFSFSYGEFVLITEQNETVSAGNEEYDYQRLLVRNRFPFVLTMTARLCRIEGTEQPPRFSVLDTQYYSFNGIRSWYTGTFESRLNIVTSDAGRFVVTDRPGKPPELMSSSTKKNNTSDYVSVDEPPTEATLPPQLAKSLAKAIREGQLTRVCDIREDRKPGGREVTWFCTLPGDHPDEVLVLTLTPRANYD